MIDRFSSKEDIDFHPEAESKGCEARLMGRGLEENPYDPILDKWLYRSWRAGWWDTDMDPAAPKRELNA